MKQIVQHQHLRVATNDNKQLHTTGMVALKACSATWNFYNSSLFATEPRKITKTLDLFCQSPEKGTM
jgi:hypothetical protein